MTLYLIIRIYRLRMFLRHWKPLLIQVQWYNDEKLRRIYEDNGILYPGRVFKIGEAEYKKYR
jgi:hypothetical protein